MKFVDFQARLQDVIRLSEKKPVSVPSFEDPAQLPALVLAYIGDAVFSLHARTVMLSAESNRVQILHTLLARMASAPLQARALRELEAGLDEQECAVVRRGRNAKSRVPRNASIAEYRSSTALEALLGYLYLCHREERLQQILMRIVETMCIEMASEQKEGRSNER